MDLSRRFSVVRDPVHGDIYLSHEELALLDTREMQRLRGIKQLGSADLVFPGARHSRFEHSIGTVHLSQAIVDATQRAAGEAPREQLRIGPEETRVIRAAALVHDITHIPYGHHVEDQAGLMHRHDSPYRYERMLGVQTEIGTALEKLGLRKDVLGVLCPEGHGQAAVPAYWRQINSDTICSDILDYLQRDAYFTGLKIGIDPRLVSHFKVDRASGNLYIDLAKHSLLREDILSEIVRMLEARYYFSERVYYHHAKVAAGALVARAVELALRDKLVDEEDFYSATDDSALDLLDRAGERGSPSTGRRIRSLVQRYRDRRLPKRACVFPRQQNEGAQAELVARYFALEGHAARTAVEQRIEDLVRFATGRDVEVMVVCPARKMQLKEAATHVRWPGEDGLRPLSEHSARVPRLADLERAYRDLWKFYVFAATDEPALLKRVGEIAAGEFPGARNLYSA
ncbi:MAG: HD domain-containing protein [Planctomycetaceae bacterium]|nr:HD domain-containing protein [Planctomycetaceae bacterium]